MSEPQRFRVADIQAQMTLGGQIMEVHPDGPYVTHSEYARLAFKSECQAEGLNAFDNKLREAEGLIARMNDTINASQAEVRRLKAEVERLTEAGDKVFNIWSNGDETDGNNFKEAIWVWTVAKNGGQP